MTRLPDFTIVEADLSRGARGLYRVERAASFEPMTEIGFNRLLDGFGTMNHRYGYVATWKGLVLGFVVVELQSQTVEILRIAVLTEYRRQGIGRALVRRVGEEHLIPMGCDVSEYNDGLILFMRACGFVAKGILKGGVYRFAGPVLERVHEGWEGMT